MQLVAIKLIQRSRELPITPKSGKDNRLGLHARRNAGLAVSGTYCAKKLENRATNVRDTMRTIGSIESLVRKGMKPVRTAPAKVAPNQKESRMFRHRSAITLVTLDPSVIVACGKSSTGVIQILVLPGRSGVSALLKEERCTYLSVAQGYMFYQ